LVLVNTWPVLVLGSLGQSQGHQGHFVKQWFPLIILETIYHRAFIFNIYVYHKGQCHKGQFCKTLVAARCLDNYISQSLHISGADWSWLGRDPYLL